MCGYLHSVGGLGLFDLAKSCLDREQGLSTETFGGVASGGLRNLAGPGGRREDDDDS